MATGKIRCCRTIAHSEGRLLCAGRESRGSGYQAAGRGAFEQADDTTKDPGRVYNLIGRTDIRQLMGVMTYCATIRREQSGATHPRGRLGAAGRGDLWTDG